MAELMIYNTRNGHPNANGCPNICPLCRVQEFIQLAKKIIDILSNSCCEGTTSKMCPGWVNCKRRAFVNATTV